MGVPELAAALTAEADKLEATLLAQARQNAQRIQREAEDKVATLRAEGERRAARQTEAEENLRKKNAVSAERKRKAAFENATVDAVRERCREQFRRFMASPAYAPFIRAELVKARDELGSGMRVHADAVTTAILEKMEGAGVTASPTVEDGFMAESANGTKRLYCTFDVRFGKLWSREAPRFVRRIAEGNGDGV